MGVPSVKTIKDRLRWLDKTHLGVDRAATIVRQAMEWAEYGGGGKPTLNEYVGHNFVAQDFGLWGEWSLDDFRSYEDRVQAALKIMDGALETFGVEGFSGRSVYGHDGFSYLNIF
jgi:hypothetical protein